MKVPLRTVHACLTILVCGCGSQTLDAGSNADAGAVASRSGVRWSEWPPSNDLNEICLPGGPTSLVGSWLGHFDNYVFPSGSNEIRIDLIDANPADGPNTPCGKIVFGGGDPPPLPTDPAAFYPPGSDPLTTIHTRFVDGGVSAISATLPQRTVYEGFRYDFAGYQLDSSVDGGHVELGIMTLQIYKAWCEMQVSYYQTGETAAMRDQPFGPPGQLAPYTGNAYDCVPSNTGYTRLPDGGCELDYGWSHQGNVWGPADAGPTGCAQLALCGACSCGPNGCTLAASADVHLDIQFQGDAGSGNASFPSDGIQAFQLQRAP